MEREKMQVEEEQRELFDIISKYSPDREPLNFDDIQEIVSHIDDAGYRKIPDGAVVLTKEELEKMDSRKNYGDVVDTLFFRIEVLKKEHENRLAQARKETAREIFLYLLDGLKKQRERYSEEYDKWDSAQRECDREDWKSEYKEKREKANGYYLMADRTIGYIQKLAEGYGVEVEE